MSTGQSDFPVINFKTGAFDNRDGAQRSVCTYMGTTFARTMGLALDHHLTTLSPRNKGEGGVILLGRIIGQYYCIKGHYLPAEDDDALRWPIQAAETVKILLFGLGLDGVVGRMGSNVIVAARHDDKTHILFELQEKMSSGVKFIEFGFTNDGIGLFEKCALPSFVARPTVLIICFGNCLCQKRSALRRNLSPYSVHFFHPFPTGSIDLPETGSPLIISSKVSGFVFWNRNSEPEFETYHSIEHDNIKRAIQKSDMAFLEDQEQVETFCKKCVAPDFAKSHRKCILHQANKKCKCEGRSLDEKFILLL